jgi:hypothetical protein
MRARHEVRVTAWPAIGPTRTSEDQAAMTPNHLEDPRFSRRAKVEKSISEDVAGAFVHGAVGLAMPS